MTRLTKSGLPAELKQIFYVGDYMDGAIDWRIVGEEEAEIHDFDKISIWVTPAIYKEICNTEGLARKYRIALNELVSRYSSERKFFGCHGSDE